PELQPIAGEVDAGLKERRDQPRREEPTRIVVQVPVEAARPDDVLPGAHGELHVGHLVGYQRPVVVQEVRSVRLRQFGWVECHGCSSVGGSCRLTTRRTSRLASAGFAGLREAPAKPLQSPSSLLAADELVLYWCFPGVRRRFGLRSRDVGVRAVVTQK